MPQTELQFLAPERLIESWDVSRSFLWRLEKAGLIKPFYLYSRKLYRAADVRRLEGMIERNELRAALRGAARVAKRKDWQMRANPERRGKVVPPRRIAAEQMPLVASWRRVA